MSTNVFCIFCFSHVCSLFSAILYTCLRTFLYISTFQKSFDQIYKPGGNHLLDRRSPELPGVMRWLFLCLIGLGSGLVAVSVDTAIDYAAGTA